MGDSQSLFEEIVGDFDYPMLVVTTATDKERAGCLVGFATQCSISPPLFVVFISNKNRTFRVVAGSTHVAVHVAPEDAENLARLFGEETGDNIDKFERCEWSAGPMDQPILTACGDWFVGEIVHRLSRGDHAGLVLSPVEAHKGGGRYFPFQKAKEFDPGHEA